MTMTRSPCCWVLTFCPRRPGETIVQSPPAHPLDYGLRERPHRLSIEYPRSTSPMYPVPRPRACMLGSTRLFLGGIDPILSVEILVPLQPLTCFHDLERIGAGHKHLTHEARYKVIKLIGRQFLWRRCLRLQLARWRDLSALRRPFRRRAGRMLRGNCAPHLQCSNWF